MNAVLKPAPTQYQREFLVDVRDEAIPLLHRHWEEIALYRDIPLAPRWDVYDKAEATGTLRIYTARKAGELIGYAAFIVMPAIHYAGSLQAAQDVLYVDDKHRNGRVGVALIRYCEIQLKSEGVQLLLQHAKADPKHVFGSLLERMGYSKMDVIYSKRLD